MNGRSAERPRSLRRFDPGGLALSDPEALSETITTSALAFIRGEFVKIREVPAKSQAEGP